MEEETTEITLEQLNQKIDGVINYVVDLKVHMDERFDAMDKRIDEVIELIKTTFGSPMAK